MHPLHPVFGCFCTTIDHTREAVWFTKLNVFTVGLYRKVCQPLTSAIPPKSPAGWSQCICRVNSPFKAHCTSPLCFPILHPHFSWVKLKIGPKRSQFTDLWSPSQEPNLRFLKSVLKIILDIYSSNIVFSPFSIFFLSGTQNLSNPLHVSFLISAFIVTTHALPLFASQHCIVFILILIIRFIFQLTILLSGASELLNLMIDFFKTSKYFIFSSKYFIFRELIILLYLLIYFTYGNTSIIFSVSLVSSNAHLWSFVSMILFSVVSTGIYKWWFLVYFVSFSTVSFSLFFEVWEFFELKWISPERNCNWFFSAAWVH